MSKSIRNFIVGIGYDYDKKGQKEIGSGIDSIRSKALQLGGVVAGAFGLKSLTTDFAATNDAMGKFAQFMGGDVETIGALGDALEHEGGSLASFMSQLENITAMRAGLLAGDAGWMAAVSRAGLDPAIITNANSATEAYLALSDAMKDMSTDQRLNLSQALGLDQASVLFLSKGREEVDAIVAKMQSIRPHTQGMAEDAAKFNDELQDAQNHIGAIADQISLKLLGPVNELLEGFNDFMGDDDADVTAGRTGDGVSDAETIADRTVAGVGVAAAALGGPITAAAGAGVAAYEMWDWDANDVERNLGLSLPDWVFNDIELPTLDPMSMANSFGNTMIGAASSVSDFVTGAPQQVNVSLNLDGKVLENKVIEIGERQNQQAIDELESNTEG